ncbi:hypothetical protein CNR22_01685 [Sphingobacteriaceae bacterium]|nr:hypothetical protein CNR22_01685 [Sphingobacteriaceae bacterium]
MKTFKMLLLITTLVVSLSQTSHAQLSANAIFTNNELVWYGLDFTGAKFIGKFDDGFDSKPTSANELISYYVPAWNQLVLDEPRNFDLKNTFRKTSIFYEIQPVANLNSKINPEGILTYNSCMLHKDQLGAMVSAYPEGSRKDGLGLVLIVESFDKSYRKGNFWVVFFDIKTHKILFSDYCSGAPSGFGLRNYWAGSLKHVLAEIRFFRYEMWKTNVLRDSRLMVIK